MIAKRAFPDGFLRGIDISFDDKVRIGRDFYLGLGEALSPHGITVTVVRPGFVHTKMTEGMTAPPLSSTADQVAEVIVGAVRRRKELVWAPAPLRGLMSVFRHIPRPIFRKLPI